MYMVFAGCAFSCAAALAACARGQHAQQVRDGGSKAACMAAEGSLVVLAQGRVYISTQMNKEVLIGSVVAVGLRVQSHVRAHALRTK
eukprot:1161309-Pelagomonas_calceolata.AAC.4